MMNTRRGTMGVILLLSVAAQLAAEPAAKATTYKLDQGIAYLPAEIAAS